MAEGRRYPRRVLVTYGSTRGGTEGLAHLVADDLRDEGVTVDLLPPSQVKNLDDYDAVVVGGALYSSRWHRQARQFVRQHTGELRQRPTYFFSSGPLDDSASRSTIPPVRQVKALMGRVSAGDHMTFGGRLARDATGFAASAMAKKKLRRLARCRSGAGLAKSIAAQRHHEAEPSS